MNLITHQNGIAGISSDQVVINNTQDAIDLLGNLYYQGFDKLIIHRENITPGFFDLKNGIAGDILQKFSNYRIRLAIVGDFTNVRSKSLRDFIRESNKGKHVFFVADVSEGVKMLMH